MVAKTNPDVEVETLTDLATKFADGEMYEEAINLYEMAIKINPESVAVKMNIARVKSLAKKRKSRRIDDLKEKVLTERHKDDIDGGQYVGLAKFYFKRRDTSQAVELLEIAKLKNADRPEPFSLLANHYFQQGDWEQAMAEVTQARTLNPFEPELAELEGRILFELKRFEDAFSSFVDATLLLPSRDHPHMKKLSQMLRTLKTILHTEKEDLNQVFRVNLEKLQIHIKRLELRREFLFSKDTRKELHEIFLKKSREGTRKEHLIKTASVLRDMIHFQHASDDQIFELSRGVRFEVLDQGAYLFKEADKSFDFHLIKNGDMGIQRDTPFGPQPLASLSAGDFVGEISFIQRVPRSTDALATKQTEIYSFPSAVVDTIIEKHPDIGTAISFAFWKSLSDKIRHSNEILKTFFSQDMKSSERMAQKEGPRASRKIEVDKKKTLDILIEKGLSAAELSLLATFSDEERYEGGSIIFREGEVGDRLYVVLDGKVRISKFIPGIGEEALAIFDKGEFFGEMSLIDASPRSADARAHEGPATVLAIDRKTLDEILKMDPRAAYQFLSLLNRLLCQRLIEINEKIIQWKYIVGVGG